MANKAKTFDDLDALHDSSTHPKQDLKAPSAPIICIPTSLSGGEYNHRGGGSNDENHRKYSFAREEQRPKLVILDPQLTTTTPERWWISSGVRAIDHCVEAMCSLKSPPQCDADSSKGLKLLVPGLLKCKKDVQDLDARFNCQLGVIEAMKAGSLYGVPMGASHGIGHQLGPMGVGHGETSCILLPAVCKYNRSVNAKQQQKVQDALVSEPELQSLLHDAGLDETADLGDMLDAIFRFLGMPRSLKEFGIGEDRLESLANNSLHDRWLPTNPRPISEKAQVMEILQMVKN